VDVEKCKYLDPYSGNTVLLYCQQCRFYLKVSSKRVKIAADHLQEGDYTDIALKAVFRILCFWASWIRIWVGNYLYGSGSASFYQQVQEF
jgi:hypothetical protein